MKLSVLALLVIGIFMFGYLVKFLLNFRKILKDHKNQFNIIWRNKYPRLIRFMDLFIPALIAAFTIQLSAILFFLIKILLI